METKPKTNADRIRTMRNERESKKRRADARKG
jgi:hypothetical protein